MLTSALIKQKAKELGATVCGIGRVYDEPNPQKDPKMILPEAKSIIGFGFIVPRTLFNTMNNQSQYYTYTTLGVKYPDEELAEIF
jgi:epoxyqueuosine reductase QueG